MFDQLFQTGLLTLLAEDGVAGASTSVVDGPGWAAWILWLPAISAILCGICSASSVRNKLPAFITSVCLGLSFVVTLCLYLSYESGQHWQIGIFDWFNITWGEESHQSFVANFGLYVDSLTLLWMLFVTGLGTLIAIYASEYMQPDVNSGGYSRFFAGVSIFLFAMSCLVMGENLIMLYLGWEGVGLASYLLIGYYYQKPEAVAAAKKAFIMNRIGDLGLALGIWLIWHNFGTVEYAELFAILESGNYTTESGGWSIRAVPYLLMLGAFGKSAQFPLFVWLPDAMEGPTPVSALIHAATMVTAGVYLLARMYPIMLLEPTSLTVVAWIGAFTALLAATIGMAQYDIKRIMAYSTVSQLGYMFVGIGVMTTYGAAYHVFTHAFFKAVLFLTCGAIMHGFAGQLDLRKLSGLRKMSGWKIVSYTMLIGCLCLAGFPLTSGYFSKDVIIAESFANSYYAIGFLALLTAGLTAYYTFRVWFRVCAGPVEYEGGNDHHGDDGHGHADHGEFHPHSPGMAINLVLVIIAGGAILAAVPYFVPSYGDGWLQHMVADSSAVEGVPAGHHGEDAHAHGDSHTAAHGSFFGFDPHTAMYFVSAIVGFIGIAIAWWLHLAKREKADDLRARLLENSGTRWLPVAMENKWYIDELYDRIARWPLWFLGHIFALFDKLIIDTLIVNGLGTIPRWMGKTFQPLQNGFLHDYAKSMGGAVVLVILFVWLMKSGVLGSVGGGG